jgi:hypothetical protein
LRISENALLHICQHNLVGRTILSYIFLKIYDANAIVESIIKNFQVALTVRLVPPFQRLFPHVKALGINDIVKIGIAFKGKEVKIAAV